MYKRQLGNADVTVICEAPKVGPHAQAMREAVGALARAERQVRGLLYTSPSPRDP
ncbi:hypothetical protein [Dyella sp. ASV21]|uniref:hypothetical protein n=1 Tax=Dyella sp. ASV21 TaxID=2795114 RepID=UPI001E520C03|nr:hypothetical protein [Dyella sp. ASV21]